MYESRLYPTSEHAYQAAKFIDPNDRRPFQNKRMTAGQAKRRGQRVEGTHPPAEWNRVKLEVMYLIVKDKFQRNDNLRMLLLSTGNAVLEEGNNWGDTFWGTVAGVGENHLGKILMSVRRELKAS